jgi:hypothetical protein
LEAFGFSRHLLKKWTVFPYSFFTEGGGVLSSHHSLCSLPSKFELKAQKQFPAIWKVGFLKENPFDFFLGYCTSLERNLTLDETRKSYDGNSAVSTKNLAVGCLNYLTHSTRPDIAFAVNQVSRYCHNPGPQHWEAVKNILAYPKRTTQYSKCFNGSSGSSDCAWSSTPTQIKRVT